MIRRGVGKAEKLDAAPFYRQDQKKTKRTKEIASPSLL